MKKLVYFLIKIQMCILHSPLRWSYLKVLIKPHNRLSTESERKKNAKDLSIRYKICKRDLRTSDQVPGFNVVINHSAITRVYCIKIPAKRGDPI